MDHGVLYNLCIFVTIFRNVYVFWRMKWKSDEMSLCTGCKEYLHERRPDDRTVFAPTRSGAVVQPDQEERHSDLSLRVLV